MNSVFLLFTIASIQMSDESQKTWDKLHDLSQVFAKTRLLFSESRELIRRGSRQIEFSSGLDIVSRCFMPQNQ